MKNSCLSVLAAFFAYGAVACSSGNVAVSGGAGSPGVAPTGSASRNAGNGSGTGGKGGSGLSGNIFFERVEAKFGAPESVIAISFLPQIAAGAATFGAALHVPQPFLPNPIFVPSAAEVTYLRSTGIGADVLASTSISNLQTQQLFAFPRPVAAFAFSAATKTLAWAGKDGALAVAGIGVAAPVVQPIRLDGYRARSVAWNSTGTRLLMRTDTDAWVFSQVGAGWQQDSVYRNVTAAAFSPEGDRIAIVGRDDHALRIVSFGSADSAAAGALTGAAAADDGPAKLDSSEVYDLNWSRAHGLTYWARLSNGSQEVRSIAMSKDSAYLEKTWVRLSVPASIRGGVVCPNWADDGAMLYFSDLVDGQYLIERHDTANAAARPTSFTLPPPSDEGYVCPKAE